MNTVFGTSATSAGGTGVMVVERPVRPGLEVDLDTGPAAGLAGLRRLVGELVVAGAEFGAIPQRYPVEWAHLVRPGSPGTPGLGSIALSASQRRLHRESEQIFRVLSVAAAAVCHGAESLGGPVLLRGLGRTDLPSLRGLVRAAEYGAATGVGRLYVVPSDATRVSRPAAPAADTRQERARCLRALGLAVGADDLEVVAGTPPAARPVGTETAGYTTALDGSAAIADRVAAALAYCRAAFYASNWEGMAVVAATCLPAATALRPQDMARLRAWSQQGVGEDGEVGPGAGTEADQAIEFEPALLRHPGDVTAYLLKVLGVQASFRARHDDALRFFRAMREVDGPLSTELRSQSHLYAALTLAKRQDRLDGAVAELTQGFAVVARQADEPASVSRERVWLHNLRGLTLFRAGDLGPALDHERSALECVDGMNDPSAVHLRVNLVSNISVLQESAGLYDQALRTWERFRPPGAQSDPAFVKHHAYRSGGLRLRAGDLDGGRRGLAESLRLSVAAADDFHEFEISAELGTLLLGLGDTDGAAGYFEQAASAATRLGDPYRMAVSAVGRAAGAGTRIGEHTAVLAQASRTQAELARTLVDGCRDGVAAVDLLPAARTKLNRPFDLVNI